MSVEGAYRETAREWKQAIEIYQTLFRFFPDNLEYGLRLANAQNSSGAPKDALATIDTLRKSAGDFGSADRPRRGGGGGERVGLQAHAGGGGRRGGARHRPRERA